VDEAMVQRALPSINYQMAVADAHLSQNTFFAAEQPCLADFYQQVCWWAVWFTPEGQSLINQYPNLKRWLGFMMSRSSAKATAWSGEESALRLLVDG
jgi:glutathione S-transferase